MPKTKLHLKVKKQGAIINKLSAKGITVKYNPKRISVYKADKYIGWVKRKDYESVARESKVIRIYRKKYARFKLKFKKTYFQKPVKFKPLKRKPRTYVIKIATYTKSQRKFVVREFKKRRIPIAKESPYKQLVDLKKMFKMINVHISKMLRPTP